MTASVKAWVLLETLNNFHVYHTSKEQYFSFPYTSCIQSDNCSIHLKCDSLVHPCAQKTRLYVVDTIGHWYEPCFTVFLLHGSSKIVSVSEMLHNIYFVPDITWSATLLLYDWEQKPWGNLGFKHLFHAPSSCSADPHAVAAAGSIQCSCFELYQASQQAWYVLISLLFHQGCRYFYCHCNCSIAAVITK